MRLLRSIHSVVKRFSEPVPERSEPAEEDETAKLKLDYRNDREIKFVLEFRDEIIIDGEGIHEASHGVG